MTPFSFSPLSYPFGEDRVLRLPEVAAITGLSVATLKRCQRRGELTFIKLSPRRIGARMSDVKAFIDTRAA